MSKDCDLQSGRDIHVLQPDDPIYAAFGLDPAAVETARILARPPRRRWRTVMVTGLAVVALAAISLFLRPTHIAAHADTATPTTAAPVASATAPSGFNDAMTQAMMSMHMAMDMPYSGDSDRDFARMMIPHHQGAVDMAKLELQYGKDTRLRRLAEEIIVTQQQEIAVMQLVLKDLAPSQVPAAPQSPATGATGGVQMNGMQMDNMQPPADPAPTTAP